MRGTRANFPKLVGLASACRAELRTVAAASLQLVPNGTTANSARRAEKAARGSWSAGSGDFLGQRPGLGGTEARPLLACRAVQVPVHRTQPGPALWGLQWITAAP